MHLFSCTTQCNNLLVPKTAINFVMWTLLPDLNHFRTVCKIIALVLLNKVNIVNILQCLAVDSILNWRHVQTSNYDNVNALRIRIQSFTEDKHSILPFAKICINVSWLVVSLMYAWKNHILHMSRVLYKCISTFNNMCYKIQRHCTILYNMYIVY